MKKSATTFFAVILALAFMSFKGGDGLKKNEAAVQQQDESDLRDCLVKYKSRWGEACSQCGNNTNDTYVAYIKNTCSKKLDVMLGVQEEGKWWRLATFYGVSSSDTLRVYACKGTGKILKWAREANDKSYPFPTQQEVNEQYK